VLELTNASRCITAPDYTQGDWETRRQLCQKFAFAIQNETFKQQKQQQ